MERLRMKTLTMKMLSAEGDDADMVDVLKIGGRIVMRVTRRQDRTSPSG